jgi:hypothetical protein
MRLQAAISRQTPTQTSIKRVRYKWIRAVRMVIDAVDTMSLPADIRDTFMDPLLKCLASAQRGSGAPQDSTGDDGDVVPGDVVPGDVASSDIDHGDNDIDPGDNDIAAGIDVTDLDIELAAAELHATVEPGPNPIMIAARNHTDSPATPSSES